MCPLIDTGDWLLINKMSEPLPIAPLTPLTPLATLAPPAHTRSRQESHQTLYWLAQRTAYPFLLLVVGSAVYWGVTHPQDLALVTALKGAVTVGLLLCLELGFPLDKRWGPTWRLLFKRDAVLLVVNGAVFGLFNYAWVLLAIDFAGRWQGLASDAPIWAQVVMGLLAFEALQYGVHRCMHLSRGPVTQFLWRTHAIHHLPQQLYLVMHIVFHPLNLLIVRTTVQMLPVWLMGFDPVAVFISGNLIALHGTISHLNFDMRLGWANYLFVGPELHRYHHSAKTHEAVNYGAALSVFDLLGGTFKYTPGRHPRDLGLSEADGYPGQVAPLRSLLFPFRRASGPSSPVREVR